MIRPVLTYPKDKDVLTQISEKVENVNDPKIQELIQDLIDTVKNSNGVGISAIQLGQPYQICVINWGNIYVLINPTITRSRGIHSMKEGCLSVPGLYVDNTRAQKVWVTALNEKGEEYEYAEGGNGSYIVQHEIDHFAGKCSLFDAYDTYMEMAQQKIENLKSKEPQENNEQN